VPSLPERADTLELVNNEIAARLLRQATAGAQVDTKAALLAGVAATATQFLASRNNPHVGYAFIAYVWYVVAFLLAVGAYALARYEDVPEPRGLVVECAHRPKDETLAFLVATRVKVFEANADKHQRKVALWWASVVSLTVGLAVSVAAIVAGEASA
jgi:hypothetical protein